MHAMHARLQNSPPNQVDRSLNLDADLYSLRVLEPHTPCMYIYTRM